MNAEFACYQCHYFAALDSSKDYHPRSLNCLQCLMLAQARQQKAADKADNDSDTLALTAPGMDDSGVGLPVLSHNQDPKQDPLTARFPDIPGFEINTVIARGGMGIIYLGRDIFLNRTVVIKTIPPEVPLKAPLRRRFQNEATAIARLNHPNVVQLYEVIWAKARPYMILEYADVGNLDHAIKLGTLPWEVAANFVAKVALAVHFAHKNGILHRDLKPSNILLDQARKVPASIQENGVESSRLLKRIHESDFDCEMVIPKVADFGLTRLLSGGEEATELTRAGSLLGTPSYMAPECFSSQYGTVSGLTDVYGIGTILYACLTGRAPFIGNNIHEITGRILQDELLSIRLFSPSVPQDLAAICYKCLEKDPRKRYQSAREVAEDLTSLRCGGVISIKPPTRIQKIHSWLIRNRTTTLAGIVLLAIGLLVTGILTAIEYRHDQKVGFLQLDGVANEQAAMIAGQVSSQMVVVEALTSFLTQQNEFRPNEFTSYCTDLVNLHEEIAALEWVPCVPAELVSDYELAGRQLYGDQFCVRGFGESGMAEDSPTHSCFVFPVYSAIPNQGNEQALGLDLNSEKTRATALQSCIREDRLRISGPIKLVQDSSQRQTAFLAFKPVWTSGSNQNFESTDQFGWIGEDGNQLRGIGVGVFRVEELITPLLENFNERLIVEIIDVTGDDQLLLYSQFPSDVNSESASSELPDSEASASQLKQGRLSRVVTIEPFGRKWDVHFYMPDARESALARSVWMTLTVGLLLTTLVSGLPFFIQLARRTT